MKFFRVLIIVAVVLLMQTIVLNKYLWLQLIDLFLLMNIYFALNSSPFWCMTFSLSTGMLQDAFSGGILGLNAFSKTVVAYFISVLSSRLMLKHPLMIILLIGISSSMDLFIIRGLHLLFGLRFLDMSPKVIAVGALLNGVTGLIAFQIADRVRMKQEYA